jgi:hypothetical protein
MISVHVLFQVYNTVLAGLSSQSIIKAFIRFVHALFRLTP